MSTDTTSLIDDCMQLVTDCENRTDSLTDWEKEDFLPSIKLRLQRCIPLTEAQIDILDEIWQKATKKGGAYVPH